MVNININQQDNPIQQRENIFLIKLLKILIMMIKLGLYM